MSRDTTVYRGADDSAESDISDHDAHDTRTDEPVETVDGAEQRSSRPAWLIALPWTLVVVALLAAGFFAWQWFGLRALADEAQAREDVSATTVQFLNTLTNWDASDGLADTQDQLREGGAGAFLDEVDQFFGGADAIEQLEERDAVSQGDIRDVYVQQLGGGNAATFATLVQTLSVDDGETSEQTARYALVDLQQVEGTWKVAGVDLVAVLPAGQPAAPGDATQPGAPPDGAPGDADTPAGETGTDS